MALRSAWVALLPKSALGSYVLSGIATPERGHATPTHSLYTRIVFHPPWMNRDTKNTGRTTSSPHSATHRPTNGGMSK